MNRTTIVAIVLAGGTGLALGWVLRGPQPGASAAPAHQVLKPPAAPAAPRQPARHEFPLGAEDVANDRETPALAADAQGRVVLAWAAQSGPLERTLYVARSADGGQTFDAPVALRKVPIYRYAARGKGPGMTFSTHVLPRLVAAAEGLFLGWVEAIDGGPAVAYYVARSTDGGKSFGEPVRVHGGDARKPGFTALAAAPDGTLLAAWLDGRNQGQQPFCAVKPARSNDFEPERLVDEGSGGKGVCPCCDVAAARLPDGSDIVAFRNNDAGHRDVWIAQAARGGSFDRAAPLSPERWSFNGCPHDGPSLAVDGDRIFAAWMSAHSGRNRVYVGASPASALAFTAAELSPGTPGAQGHPKLVVVRPGALCAVWDESLDAAVPESRHEGGHGPSLTGAGRAIMLARGTAQGFGPAVAVAPRESAFQLNPAVTVAGDGALVVAWSEVDAHGKRIVVTRNEAQAKPTPLAVASTDRPTHGRLVFLAHCARCHGPEGRGDGLDAAALRPPPRDLAAGPWRTPPTREAVRTVIRDGLPGTMMSGLSAALSPRELDAVVDFVIGLAPRDSHGVQALRSAGFTPASPARRAPALEVRDADGRLVTLDSLRGKPVMLAFWGTSCAPCVKELPELARFAARCQEQDVAVLAVCADETDPAAVRSVIEQYAPGLPVYLDPTGAARVAYDVQALPSAAVIGPDGTLLGTAQGSLKWSSPAMMGLVESSASFTRLPAQR